MYARTAASPCSICASLMRQVLEKQRCSMLSDEILRRAMHDETMRLNRTRRAPAVLDQKRFALGWAGSRPSASRASCVASRQTSCSRSDTSRPFQPCTSGAPGRSTRATSPSTSRQPGIRWKTWTAITPSKPASAKGRRVASPCATIDRLVLLFGAQAIHHRARQVDAVVCAHVRRNRQRDSPCADADLQHAARRCEAARLRHQRGDLAARRRAESRASGRSNRRRGRKRPNCSAS